MTISILECPYGVESDKAWSTLLVCRNLVVSDVLTINCSTRLVSRNPNGLSRTLLFDSRTSFDDKKSNVSRIRLMDIGDVHSILEQIGWERNSNQVFGSKLCWVIRKVKSHIVENQLLVRLVWCWLESTSNSTDVLCSCTGKQWGKKSSSFRIWDLDLSAFWQLIPKFGVG